MKWRMKPKELKLKPKEFTTLKVWKELGEKQLQGYRYNDGLLVQGRLIEWQVFSEVIVVPGPYRKKIME